MTEQLLRKGLEAFAAGDMSTAVEKLGEALGRMSLQDPVRLDVMPALASALARTGELTRADTLLTECIEAAAAAGDRCRELRARVARESNRLQTGQLTEDGAHRFAEAVIPELDQLGDALGLAKAWHLLADGQPTWTATTETLEHALLHAQRSGDQREIADIVWWLGVSFHHGPTPVGRAIARCEELLAAVSYDRTVEAGMLGMLAGLYAMQGRFDEARDFFARGLAILEELGIKLRLATRRTISGEIELLAGDPIGAERELRWGYERLVEMGERGDLPAITAQLAEALYRQARFDEAERFALESEKAYGGVGTGATRSKAVRAKILAQRGEFDSAETLAREAVAQADKERLNVLGDAQLDLAKTLTLAGCVEEAASAAREALRSYEAKENIVSAREAEELLGRLVVTQG